ncbi:hypothetical protein BDP81DRAFT_86921 [Colletotrichum phormii]|uniref:Secreted protein n=1 Tax=Colletotrichum phormii TaxID=359342 RepID=A0AAJ0EMJ5_9PEZI|nr:uncharacterized protein BDP81DRAFT_86921 [Colletotrichum phormii]KAK1654679.1 hypothetical protein BDP81DRAFT_86921 [Colletotrichum phormii]
MMSGIISCFEISGVVALFLLVAGIPVAHSCMSSAVDTPLFLFSPLLSEQLVYHRMMVQINVREESKRERSWQKNRRRVSREIERERNNSDMQHWKAEKRKKMKCNNKKPRSPRVYHQPSHAQRCALVSFRNLNAWYPPARSPTQCIEICP